MDCPKFYGNSRIQTVAAGGINGGKAMTNTYVMTRMRNMSLRTTSTLQMMNTLAILAVKSLILVSMLNIL